MPTHIDPPHIDVPCFNSFPIHAPYPCALFFSQTPRRIPLASRPSANVVIFCAPTRVCTKSQPFFAISFCSCSGILLLVQKILDPSRLATSNGRETIWKLCSTLRNPTKLVRRPPFFLLYWYTPPPFLFSSVSPASHIF